MQLEPGSPLRATDRSGVEVAAKLRPSRQLRVSVWAAVIATIVATTIGWAPLRDVLFAGSPGATPMTLRERPAPGAVASLPLSAQVQLAGMLAAGRPAYRAAKVPSGYVMANQTQTLTTRFGRSGVSISAGAKHDLKMNLSLRSVALGSHGSAVAAATPTARGNRVAYAHAGIREWYRDSPLGLEQGFDVERAPSGRGSGRLVLTMALGANAPAVLSADGRRLTLHRGSASLSYDGLVVSDAAGRVLHSHLALARGELLIEADARHARFPLTIDPLIQQGTKLTGGGANPEEEARFGTSAALSADGSTLLIGGPEADGSRGAVWAFTRSGASWTQQGSEWTGDGTGGGGTEECAEEAAEESGECSFGASVALSADGNTALVGDPSQTSSAGVAWVFTRSGTTWSAGEQLPSGTENGEAWFGRSVAMSADGNTALVGVPSTEQGRGSAAVFTRSAGGWTRGAPLSSAETKSGAHFGRSVAMSSDGSEALIGAPGDSSYVGAAWAFARHGSTWVAQPGKLVGGGESGSGHFGKSVALSGDGATALIGGRDDSDEQGAVWTFTRSGESFAQQGEKLAGTPEAGSQFGYSVALSGDGSVALIGAPHEESALGTVNEFTRSGSGWTPVLPALGGTEAVGKGDSGASVALAENGEVAAIGAPRDNKKAGGAWVFAFVAAAQVPGPTVSKVTPSHGPPEGGTIVTINGSNFTREGGVEPVVMFGSTPATSARLSSKSALTAVTPPGVSGSTVDVTVQTATGTSAISANDAFRYERNEASAKTGTSTGSAGTSSSTTTAATTGAATGVLGSTQASAGACRVTLHSKHVAVALHRTARIRLMRSGEGECRGTLTLRYRQKGRGKHFKLRTIGSVRFAIAPGKSQVVSIKLNKLGRSLFIAAHGKLNASAAVVRTTPAPTLATSASVRLSVKKKPKAKPAQT
jgi:hypothetical protein